MHSVHRRSFIPGCGSSDYNCSSHLFSMTEDPLHFPLFIQNLLYFRMDRLKGELAAGEGRLISRG